MRKLALILILTGSCTFVFTQSVPQEEFGKQFEEMQKEMWKMLDNMTKQLGDEPIQIDTFFFKGMQPFGSEQIPGNSQELFKDMNRLFEQFFGNFDKGNNSFLMPFMEQWKEQLEQQEWDKERLPDDLKEQKNKFRSRKKRKSYTL